MRAYLFMQWLLRTATQVFFRRIEVVGLENIPTQGEGAVIFCGNHPNSLIDPVMITAYCGRIIHFAAKDVLFRNRILRFFLTLMGAVPIRRRTDHKQANVNGTLDNQSAFDALHRVLGEGRAIGIFPEGLSHEDSQLAPLKTGAARIALGAKQAHPKTRIFLVPTGLCYFRRSRFRSSVLVQFGEPREVHLNDEAVTIEAHERADNFTREQKHRKHIRRITDDMAAHLRALTINADSWETIWVLDGVRRLYQPADISLEKRVELSRRFNHVYPGVADAPQIKSLYKQVRRYLVRLSAAGITDDALREPVRVRNVILRITGHTLLLLGALPLAILGAPIHLPLLFLFRVAGKHFAPRSDVVATTKFLVGFITINLVYLALIVTTWWKLNVFWAILIAILFPLSGRAVLHVISRADALRNIFLTSFRILRFRHEVNALRCERRKLVAAVNVAVENFRPTDMPALFSSPPEAVSTNQDEQE